jgi:murein DD-endopeptidase MepM/ murein hydrolase activator NlpD
MGDTGKASGIHSHYEVWRFNQRRNPMVYLKGDYADSEALARLSKPAKPQNPS